MIQKQKRAAIENMLFDLVFHQGIYYVSSPRRDFNYDNVESNVWLNVKGMHQHDRTVTVGNIVRFGKINFRIYQIRGRTNGKI